MSLTGNKRMMDSPYSRSEGLIYICGIEQVVWVRLEAFPIAASETPMENVPNSSARLEQ